MSKNDPSQIKTHILSCVCHILFTKLYSWGPFLPATNCYIKRACIARYQTYTFTNRDFIYFPSQLGSRHILKNASSSCERPTHTHIDIQYKHLQIVTRLRNRTTSQPYYKCDVLYIYGGHQKCTALSAWYLEAMGRHNAYMKELQGYKVNIYICII